MTRARRNLAITRDEERTTGGKRLSLVYLNECTSYYADELGS